MRVFNRYFIFFLLLIVLFTIVILNPCLLFTYLVNPARPDLMAGRGDVASD